MRDLAITPESNARNAGPGYKGGARGQGVTSIRNWAIRLPDSLGNSTI